MAANGNANLLQGEVMIDLDKPRKLKLNFRACKLYEQETGGHTVDEFFLTVGAIALKHGVKKDDEPIPVGALVELFQARRIDQLATMLWACLVHEDRRLTTDQAFDLLERAFGETMEEKQTYVMGKLAEVWRATRKQRPPAEPEATEGATTEGTDRPPENASAGPTT